MNESDIEVTVKMKDILNAPLISAWDRFCEKYGCNEWAFNEGLGDNNTTVKISLSDAKFYGLIRDWWDWIQDI